MDVNTAYKLAWTELKDQLGRNPDTRDKEWWELSERYKRSVERGRWEDDPRTGTTQPDRSGSDRSAGVSESTRASSQSIDPPGVRSGGRSVEEPMGINLRADSGSGGGSAPGAAGVNPRAAQAVSGLIQTPYRSAADQAALYSSPVVGARGPGGGLYARCKECGRVWEREKRRGRPVKVCRECAK